MKDNYKWYTQVATNTPLSYRLQRGQNAVISLYGEENGKKWLLKTPRVGENPNIIANEIEIIRQLQDSSIVPELHPEYLDDSWGESEEYAMLMINNAASLGDYAEAALAGEIPLETLGEILKVSLESIDQLHRYNIIHNDLHGNNLVISINTQGEWQVYIIDFGWSYTQNDLPNWIAYERAWIAQEPEDDMNYLANDLEGRSQDEAYISLIGKFLRP
ncbi:protein kinase domain-containing protein [Spirulina subsalsa]|uniref:protein kinase domain-containing protein n=1 Tax=Spirulina subsalsa TaxID=54311 RepID=UPI0002F44CE4|nr:hypothetical protein [Spirulina subsalsa]